MAISKSNLKFYLTSLEAGLAQNNLSQSLGGHVSLSEIYPSTNLSQGLDIFGSTFNVSDYTKIQNATYLNINDEIIRVNNVSSNNIVSNFRSFNNVKNCHNINDIVYKLGINGLFNNHFNDDLKQYRCIALKNIDNYYAYNVSLYLDYLKYKSNSIFKFAIEQPASDPSGGTATGGSKITLINSSLAGLYYDNYFYNAYLTILNGPNINQSRTILTFDKNTGTITFDSSFPFTITAGTSYKIDIGYCQRISSGVISPIVGTNKVSSFTTDMLNINFNNLRTNGNNLAPQEAIYIWIERSLTKGSANLDLNSINLKINYYTS